MKCPVCEYQSENSQFCTRCGWEFKVYVTEIGDEEKAVYGRRLEIARRNWRDLQKRQAAAEAEPVPPPAPELDAPRDEPDEPAPPGPDDQRRNWRIFGLILLAGLLIVLGFQMLGGESPEPEKKRYDREDTETVERKDVAAEESDKGDEEVKDKISLDQEVETGHSDASEFVISIPEPIDEQVATKSPYNENTPVPSMKRDQFETVREFESRINSYPPVRAGQGRLIKREYDIESNLFPLTVEWDKWVRDLPGIPATDKVTIAVARDPARILHEKGPEYPLYARLKAEGETVRVETVELVDATLVYPLQLPLEPVVSRKTINGPLEGMTFVYIPPGEFQMGSPPDEPGRGSNEKQHTVTLTNGFYMQTTEVTQKQWGMVMERKKCLDLFLGDCEKPPIENVSWDDTQSFIEKLNQRAGKPIYRLPTEAEWEYAARAGTTTPFAFGKCLSTDAANYDGDYSLADCSPGKNRGKTIPAGSLSANEWGLYDMHGNVWEWCQDWYGEYPEGPVTDPQGPDSGEDRVLRGGSWNDDAWVCRSANRGGLDPSVRNDYLGFRLVRSYP